MGLGTQFSPKISALSVAAAKTTLTAEGDRKQEPASMITTYPTPQELASADVATQNSPPMTDIAIQSSLLEKVYDISTITMPYTFILVSRITKHRTGRTDNRGAPRALTPLNEFFLILCRLRLGLDLAYRFSVSQSTVSRVCIMWMNFLFMKLREVPIWPTRQ